MAAIQFPAGGLLLLVAACMALPEEARAAEATASYRVTFQGTWTRAATPGGLPGGAHFSPLIGALHDENVVFWEPGAMASPGIERVAELGATHTFRREIEASEHAAGILEKLLPGGGTPEAHIDFDLMRDYPLVTLITMIAPSPDWFVGVSGLSLLDAGGEWVSRLEVDLFPYDAGTEDGDGFSLSNPATVPQGYITSIRGMGKFTDEPMAKFIFARQGADAGVWNVPLFPAASDPDTREGFARVINRSAERGEVRIVAIDDRGMSSEPLTLAIGAGETAHFNSEDLESGNPGKGLTGSALQGEGHWRLELASGLDLEVLSYIRTQDGFLTAMHDTAPTDGDVHRVAVFNPAANDKQVSTLRLINPGAEDAQVTIEGVDDRGQSPGTEVMVRVPAGAASSYSAQALESGTGDLQGALGDGAGKWRLTVRSGQPLMVMSLLASPTGHLTNLSTAPASRVGMR